MNDQPTHTFGVVQRWLRQGAQQVRSQVRQGLDKHPETVAAGREFAQAVKADAKAGGQQLAALGRQLRTVCADAAVACLSPAEREALHERLRRQRQQGWPESARSDQPTDTHTVSSQNEAATSDAADTSAPRRRRTAPRQPS